MLLEFRVELVMLLRATQFPPRRALMLLTITTTHAPATDLVAALQAVCDEARALRDVVVAARVAPQTPPA